MEISVSELNHNNSATEIEMEDKQNFVWLTGSYAWSFSKRENRSLRQNNTMPMVVLVN